MPSVKLLIQNVVATIVRRVESYIFILSFQISYKSDIWSLGCILYNLLYGKTPFQHIAHPWAKIAAITNPHHTIDYPKTRNDCPPVILEAVQLCLTFDPKKRPTAAELLELPYINYNPVRRFSPQNWAQWLGCNHMIN